MMLAYGHNRDRDALLATGADRVYPDHAASRRVERAALLRDIRPYAGDVVIVLDMGDLGHGKEAARIADLIREAGAEIQVANLPERPKKRPGRKPRFNPSPDDLERVKAAWHGPLMRQQALDHIAEIMGHEVTVNQLNWHLGSRGKPKS